MHPETGIPVMTHEAEADIARLATGSRELDEILGGGIPANSINIIMGAPGSGKTALAEEFVFANADDEQRPILYLTTLSEPLTWALISGCAIGGFSPSSTLSE